VHILNRWFRFSHGFARRVRRQLAPPAPREGLSQDDLAYEAEVSRSYLSQLEKGAFYASLKIIGRLAEALQVEPAELLKRGAAENRRS
jgi:transcriptional regulator with XRE-family HTH domain